MNTALLEQAGDEMAHELLARGESIRFIARGRSMWPFVLDGDHVVVEPIAAGLAVGDVVLLPHPGLGRLHRVTAISSDGHVRVRGDALVQSDGWFPSEILAGRLVAIERNGRDRPVRSGSAVVALSTVLGLARRAVSLLK